MSDPDLGVDPTASAIAEPLPPATPQREGAAEGTLSGYLHHWWQGVRTGELGSLPPDHRHGPAGRLDLPGVALATTGKESPDELMRGADAAMYRAKDRGRSRAVTFDESLAALEALETSVARYASSSRKTAVILSVRRCGEQISASSRFCANPSTRPAPAARPTGNDGGRFEIVRAPV